MNTSIDYIDQGLWNWNCCMLIQNRNKCSEWSHQSGSRNTSQYCRTASAQHQHPALKQAAHQQSLPLSDKHHTKLNLKKEDKGMWNWTSKKGIHSPSRFIPALFTSFPDFSQKPSGLRMWKITDCEIQPHRKTEKPYHRETPAKRILIKSFITVNVTGYLEAGNEVSLLLDISAVIVQ